MENIDTNILIQAQKGDLKAFEYIVFFYEKALYNYCLKTLRNSQNAKDVVQETFIKLYNHRTSIDPEKNIKTWIFTIATNTAYDLLRAKKRKGEVSLEDEFETISASQTYHSQEGLLSDVEKALHMIDPAYKDALLLFYQQGFAYKEIGDMLGIPINTVKTHISRGKKQLKDILQNYSE